MPLGVNWARLVSITNPVSVSGGWRVEVGPNVDSAGPWARLWDIANQRDVLVTSQQAAATPTAVVANVAPFAALRVFVDNSQTNVRTFTVTAIAR